MVLGKYVSFGKGLPVVVKVMLAALSVCLLMLLIFVLLMYVLHERLTFIVNLVSAGKCSSGTSWDRLPNICKTTDPLLVLLILEGSLEITAACCKA